MDSVKGEYGSFVLAHAAPEGPGEWPEIMERLLARLETVLEAEDDAWELVSHDFLLSGDSLVATFFTRRIAERAKP